VGCEALVRTFVSAVHLTISAHWPSATPRQTRQIAHDSGARQGGSPRLPPSVWRRFLPRPFFQDSGKRDGNLVALWQGVAAASPAAIASVRPSAQPLHLQPAVLSVAPSHSAVGYTGLCSVTTGHHCYPGGGCWYFSVARSPLSDSIFPVSPTWPKRKAPASGPFRPAGSRRFRSMVLPPVQRLRCSPGASRRKAWVLCALDGSILPVFAFVIRQLTREAGWSVIQLSFGAGIAASQACRWRWACGCHRML